MPVIVTLIIAMFLILVGWTWHNLGNIEAPKKLGIITISFIIMIIITFIIFNISKESVQYESQGAMEAVRNILVILFANINGLVLMPSIAKTLSKSYEKQIDKSQIRNRIIAIVIIFIVFSIFECGYMKNIQQEILKIYNEALLK